MPDLLRAPRVYVVHDRGWTLTRTVDGCHVWSSHDDRPALFESVDVAVSVAMTHGVRPGTFTVRDF